MEIVTLSKNIRTGDISYSTGFWQIVGQNETHTMIHPIEDRKHDWGGDVMVLNGDHQFSCARSLVGNEKYLSLLRRGVVRI